MHDQGGVGGKERGGVGNNEWEVIAVTSPGPNTAGRSVVSQGLTA